GRDMRVHEQDIHAAAAVGLAGQPAAVPPAGDARADQVARPDIPLLAVEEKNQVGGFFGDVALLQRRTDRRAETDRGARIVLVVNAAGCTGGVGRAVDSVADV